MIKWLKKLFKKKRKGYYIIMDDPVEVPVDFDREKYHKWFDESLLTAEMKEFIVRGNYDKPFKLEEKE